MMIPTTYLNAAPKDSDTVDKVVEKVDAYARSFNPVLGGLGKKEGEFIRKEAASFLKKTQAEQKKKFIDMVEKSSGKKLYEFFMNRRQGEVSGKPEGSPKEDMRDKDIQKLA